MPVYLAQMDDLGYIKLGYSKNPRKRVSDLQVASPVKLRLIGEIPGGRELETRLHQILKATGTKSNGEWYEPSPALDCLCRIAEAEIDIAPLIVLLTDEQVAARIIAAKKAARPRKKITLSEAERKRRSERMRKLHAEGRAGPKYGKLGGRPTNETVAQKALENL